MYSDDWYLYLLVPGALFALQLVIVYVFHKVKARAKQWYEK